jgi:hypothetical protein
VYLRVKEVNLKRRREGTSLYNKGKSDYKSRKGSGLFYKGRKRQSSFIGQFYGFSFYYLLVNLFLFLVYLYGIGV